ncbi:MAG: hypothetical protein V3W01_02810 [Dehalococcoidales bacterium]
MLAVLILSLGASALAAEPANGVVEGRVVNGTEGSGQVADQEITLQTYLDDTEVASATTRTDAEGRFIFTGLATESDYSYYITLSFQEAGYDSERFGFGPGETTKSVDMTVYDSTSSDEVIRVEISHTVIYIDSGRLLVKEFYLFTNGTDRTYIGSKRSAAEEIRQTLRFYLPDGATGLQPAGDLMECCILDSDEGFVDSMPVLPGFRDIHYSYSIGFTSGDYTLTWRVNYPIELYELLVQDVGVRVTSDQMVTSEPLDFEGMRFNHLYSQELAVGDVLVVSISGLPQTSGPGTVMWVVLVLGLLTFGFSLSYLLRRKRPQPASPAERLDQRRQSLLVELAQLDDEFGAGKVPLERYRRLRQDKKAQLVELVKRSQVDGDSSS